MVEMKVEYKGDLRCELTHNPSGTSMSTDAPKDNMGKGESFSPTDMIAASLASCAITTMAIVAQRNNIQFESSSAKVTKQMTSEPPRKIARLTLEIQMPQGLSPEHQTSLQEAARGCPVARSLSPDIDLPITFK